MANPARLTRASIQFHFQSLKDPRTRAGKVKHPLLNIIVMALCATIGNADDTQAIAAFAWLKRDWFAKFLDLPRLEDGTPCTPSHDTFERVLCLLDPVQFQKCLIGWTQSLHEIDAAKWIAIDGKVIREAMKRAQDQGPLTLVSAWASKQSLLLGQMAGAAGSNELGALPSLLELLELQGAIVTIDAIGCQKNLVEQIVDAKGDYVISVKGNQESLHGVVVDAFSQALDNAELPENSHTTTEAGHGRKETRTTIVLDAPEFADKASWKGLASLIMVHRTSIDKKGTETSGTRYYISSLRRSAKYMSALVRNHWSIENELHWQMDVTFKEDRSRAWQGNLPANLGILRRIALSMIKNGSDGKQSLKLTRQTAGWDEKTLEKLVFAPKPGQS